MRVPTSIVRTLGVWLLVAAGSVAAAPSPPELKLPDTVVPARYELQLTLDPDADEYSGTIGIEVRIAAPTDLVWINATRLQILDARASVDPAQADGLPAEIVPGNDDVVGLRFAAPLPAGEARLALRFKGRYSTSDVAGLAGDEFRAESAHRDLSRRDRRRPVGGAGRRRRRSQRDTAALHRSQGPGGRGAIRREHHAADHRPPFAFAKRSPSQRVNQPAARSATASSVPGSSNR